MTHLYNTSVIYCIDDIELEVIMDINEMMDLLNEEDIKEIINNVILYSNEEELEDILEVIE